MFYLTLQTEIIIAFKDFGKLLDPLATADNIGNVYTISSKIVTKKLLHLVADSQCWAFARSLRASSDDSQPR
ncbi:MAG: hypothetical protein ACOYOS_14125 [Syntrophales bacterium]